MEKKKIGLVSLALLLAGMLAACGSAAEPRTEYSAAPGEVVVVEKVMESTVVDDSYTADVTASGADSNQAQVERMIIWNATISLTVDDTEASMAAVQALARALGGYPTGSDSWLEGEQLHAQLTIRVPAERFDEAMAQLRDLALKVNRESASSEDVTDQYVDLESRLRHLEAKEAQLLAFMEDAEDTEAVLAVYEHLDATQAEIEQVKGRMKYLSTLAAMATITVDLRPEEAEPPVIEEGWKPGRTVRDAARALLKTLERFADLAIWIAIYLLPILLFVALPIAAIIWAVRRRRRKQQPEEPLE